MKTLKIITACAFLTSMTACSIDIDADGHYKRGHDTLTVELNNGDRASFSCPKGTSSYIRRDKEGFLLEYGCVADPD